MNEVMNGANSALKDQTLSLLSRETNKTYTVERLPMATPV